MRSKTTILIFWWDYSHSCLLLQERPLIWALSMSKWRQLLKMFNCWMSNECHLIKALLGNKSCTILLVSFPLYSWVQQIILSLVCTSGSRCCCQYISSKSCILFYYFPVLLVGLKIVCKLVDQVICPTCILPEKYIYPMNLLNFQDQFADFG